jgi:O-antigen/teichoic acid export membrane protein
LVGLYLNPVAVALLAVVKVFAAGFQLYRQAMALIVFPVFARLHAENRKEDIKAFYEKGIYYSNIVLVSMVVGLILLSGFLFDVVLKKYQPGRKS